MRWTATIGAWTRREALLTSALALAAALAALSEPLSRPWLATAGLFVALAGAAVRIIIGLFRGQTEKRREIAESLRRLRVPVQSIDAVNPTRIGVDPAAQDMLDGEQFPIYLSRKVDQELTVAITEAFDGPESWLVIVTGASKTGKSRTLFESLRACSKGMQSGTRIQIVAPVDGDSLRTMLLPGSGPRLGSQPAVLWLDDLEPFLNQSVTLHSLQEWRASGPRRIVVGTYGGKGSDLVAEAGAGEKLTTVAGQLLQHAREVHMGLTTADELRALDRPGVLQRPLQAPERDAVARFGLAAYLVAGPALERKLTTGRHAPGLPSCAEGVAVVRAIVDWSRCGRVDAISEELLSTVWGNYTNSLFTPTIDALHRGIEWSCRPVAGSVALVYRKDGFIAYDYVVRIVRDSSDAVAPENRMWEAAIQTAEPENAGSVAAAAYLAGRFSDARDAFEIAAKSNDTQTAANSRYNLGVLMDELGQPLDSLIAYQHAVDAYSNSTKPGLRQLVAKALVNMGALLGRLGRPDEAVATYQTVIGRYQGDPNLDDQTARALVNIANRYAQLERHEESLTATKQVVDLYSGDPAQKEPIARALANMGNRYGRLGRHYEAIGACEQVVDLFVNDPDPELREPVATALTSMGYCLGSLGRHGEAVDAFEQLLSRFGDESETDLQDKVAHALYSTGVSLGEMGQDEDAVAAYRRLMDRFGGDPDHRDLTAASLVNMALRLGDLGSYEESLEAAQEVIELYGDDPDASLRPQVASALVIKGNRLGDLGRSDDAIPAYENVLDRYGSDLEPVLREQCAFALCNLGISLRRVGRIDDAIGVYEQVVSRYGTDAALRPQVCRALENLANHLNGLNKKEDAQAAYRQIVDLCAGELDVGLRRQLGKAMIGMGNIAGDLGHDEEALRWLRQVLDSYGSDADGILQGECARALYNIGVTLESLGETEKAAVAYREVLGYGGRTSGIEDVIALADIRLQDF